MFLAVTSALTLMTLVAQGATGYDAYRPAARSLFAVMAAGIAVLWPMLRLSQALARQPTGPAVSRDIAVLIFPAQAVLWPQTMYFLAAWPPDVIGACAALLSAWTLLIGAVLSAALAHVGLLESSRARSSARPRAAWMAAIIGLVALGPLLGLISPLAPGGPGLTHDAALTMLASPITGVLEITADRPWSGQAASDLPAHWWAVGITFTLGIASWFVGAPLRRRFRASLADPATGPGQPDGIQPLESNPLHNAAIEVPGSGSADTGGIDAAAREQTDGTGHQSRS